MPEHCRRGLNFRLNIFEYIKLQISKIKTFLSLGKKSVKEEREKLLQGRNSEFESTSSRASLNKTKTSITINCG